jgi:hypothetical protein
VNYEDERRIIQAAFNRAHIAPAPGFEARMRAALERAGRPKPIHTHPPRLREGLAVLVAVVAVAAVVAGLMGPRLFTHGQQPVGLSSPSPSPSASPSPDPNACRLPIVVNDESNHARNVVAAGFIDVASGQFTADPSVSLADLPHVAPQGGTADLELAQYDPAVKRWLPSDVWSPDGRSYVYVTFSGGVSELHVYNVVQGTDRIVWTYAGSISVPDWKQDGIYAASPPYPFNPRFVSPDQKYWRINPVSGIATEIDAATFNPYASLISSLTSPPPTTAGRGPSLSIQGNDPGRALYRIGGRDGGTQYLIVVIIDGARTDIYSGVQGDQMDFDPYNVQYDGSLLWFSNFDSKYLWSWTAAGGLKRHSLQIPNATGDPVHPVLYRVAGPCL